MGNVKDYFTGNFLRAEDCKENDIVTFKAEGETEEITTKDGKTKSVLNYDVEINGKVKTFTPNKSNGNKFIEAWGEDDKEWVGKQFTVKLVKVNVFGKVQDSIVAEPLVPEKKQMAKEKPKAIEEWGVGEWETAYNALRAKFENLRNHMRIALQHLNKAI